MNETMLRECGASLLRWHGRTERDLPWKGETDPYRIWISETMLQQTRAAVVAKRYAEFLAVFPTVRDLAEADGQQVLALWQGMGYYARARNLHAAAKAAVERFGGKLPETEDGLRSLPGVGEYTACAVLSMAHGVSTAAVDANLARVISRVFGVRGYVEDNKTSLREAGTRWLLACAPERPGDFNRALMGIGAMVCTAKAPRCAECPLAQWCRAYAEGEQEILPEKRPKNARKEEEHTLCIARSGDCVLVRQRPEKGMLASLWEFPHFVCGCELLPAEMEQEGIPLIRLTGEGPCTRFTFTHRVWRITALYALCEAETEEPYRWVTAEELAGLPMPSVMEPYRQAAEELLA